MIRDSLQEVMDLQPSYTAKNSPAMTRRGALVRRMIPDELMALKGSVAASLGVTEVQVQIRGSDGVGQKTPYCWTRIASDLHSPDPRHGWYLVFLFDAEGKGVYLSLNQGTTVWDGIGFNPQDPRLLMKRVRWARSILPDLESAPRLLHQINLRGRGPLGRSYEAGNVVAFLYRNEAVPTDTDIRADIQLLSEYLGQLYHREELGRVPGSPSPEEIAVLEAASPNRARSGQGRGLNAGERAAVEKHAMTLASDHLRALGYEVHDTSAESPYDLACHKDGKKVLIAEVKGTTTFGESVILTTGEVRAQRDAHPNNALIIVHSINLDRHGEKPHATGGTLVLSTPWSIAEEHLEPIAFLYRPGGR